MESFQFRFMRLEDIEVVHELDTICFTAPWTLQAFRNELTQNQLAYYVVVEFEDTIIAYGGMWIIIDESHITNIAVHPDFRGKGLGQQLMEQLIELARELGAKRMTLEVRKSNEIAQSLYKKLGFEATGIRKGYYLDNHEDAVIMWANLEV